MFAVHSSDLEGMLDDPLIQGPELVLVTEAFLWIPCYSMLDHSISFNIGRGEVMNLPIMYLFPCQKRSGKRQQQNGAKRSLISL